MKGQCSSIDHLITSYKGKEVSNASYYYALYIPGTSPRSKSRWKDMAPHEQMYEDLISDHQGVGKDSRYVSVIVTRSWEDLMDWCIAKLDLGTWKWDHTAKDDPDEYTLSFEKEEDFTLFTMTWR